MLEFLVSRFFFLLFWALGVGALIGFVYWANWTIGIKWSRDVWPVIKNDPQAMATHFGWRFFAIAVFVGLLAIAGAII